MFVNPLQLISRWIHQISIAIIGGTTLLSTLGYITLDKSNHLPVTLAGVFALLSGFLNAHFASSTVKNMQTEAKWWRIAIYGIKIPLFLTLTPALNIVVKDQECQNTVKFFSTVALFLVSSLAKFYREFFNPVQVKALPKDEKQD